MLVLSRKVGEKIYVGKDVVITVHEVQGRKVRLTFEAPKTVRIALTPEPTDEPAAPVQRPAV